MVGDKYLVQQESNKGCHYLSLWRLTPKAACLCRVCFEVFDGISEETVEELLDQRLPDGHTVRDMIESPDMIPTIPEPLQRQREHEDGAELEAWF